MAGETTLTIVGNLVDDPELRYTAAGAPVANFRVASTPRVYDRTKGEFADGDPLFLTCTAWRDMAEHVAESLTRGSRVIVSGQLRQDTYETKEGERRTVYKVSVDDIGPSLRYATAAVHRKARGGPQAGPADDPWAGTDTAAPNADTARTRARAGAGSRGFEDTPPF